MSPPTASENRSASAIAGRDHRGRPENETSATVRPLAAMDWEDGKLRVIRDYDYRQRPREEEVSAIALVDNPLRFFARSSDIVVEGIHINTPRRRSNAQIYWLQELLKLEAALKRFDINLHLYPHRLVYRYEEFAKEDERIEVTKKDGTVVRKRDKKYDYRFLLRLCKSRGLPAKAWSAPNSTDIKLRFDRDQLRASIGHMANLLRTTGRGLNPDAVDLAADFSYHVHRIAPLMPDSTREYFDIRVTRDGRPRATRRESMLVMAYASVFNERGERRVPREAFSVRYITAMAGLSEHGCASHVRSTILGGDVRTDKSALKHFATVVGLFAGTRPTLSSRESDQPDRRA